MSAPDEKRPPTRGQRVNADLTTLIKARNSLLWVTTTEEVRVERAIIEAAAAADYEVRFWDCVTGLTEIKSGKEADLEPQMTDPVAMLAKIRTTPKRAIYVMRDVHKWFDPVVLRALRTTARKIQGTTKAEARAIVLLTPSSEVPRELAGQATVVDYPIPDRAEIALLLDDVLSILPPDLRGRALAEDRRDAAIDAAVGLTADEAANCYSRSLVTSRTIDPALVAGEKKRVIAREKVLTWYDPDPRGLDAVGGLDDLKAWLRTRRSAFSARARAFGLPAPRGALLVGVPGTGKSLTAKAVATAWGMPLLRIDMGALKSKWIGESEANVRKAFAVAEAVSPCVLWVDEIEKALQGSTGGAADGGVSADALGALLSWMQERKAPVFVLATANDVSALPPELLRKGRFDEVFFTDLPTARERAEIAKAAMREAGRALSDEGAAKVAIETRDFTGAEIAALVPDALFAAFDDGEREVEAEDLVVAARATVPLAKTASEKIAALREWAKGRARRASSAEESGEGLVAGRDVEL